MKYHFTTLFIFIISIFSVISCSQQNENSFNISGKVGGLINKVVILSKSDNLQKKTRTIIDSLTINAQGEFNASYTLEPTIYYLTFDDKTIELAVDYNQNIVINGNSKDEIEIAGSTDTQLLKEYESFRIASLERLVKSVRKEIKELKKSHSNTAKITRLRELEVENYTKHLNELISFVKEKMGTSIAIYYSSTRWNGDENLPFLKDLVISFEEKYPNLEITQKLKNKIQLLKKTSIGSSISNIEMPNNKNEIISLNNINKKYTLVDFWASWCPPCRTESSLLNELYSKYQSKGFEIYGISLDSRRNSWLKALEKDNRIWTEVSQLEGFNTPTTIKYGITALPSNFLIDATGKIIAVNIHGKTLTEKLEKLFE